MAKSKQRQHDTGLWSEYWFRNLEPEQKLVYKFLIDNTDHAGLWEIDLTELLEVTGLESFNLKKFVEAANMGRDKMTGEQVVEQRVLFANDDAIWLVYQLQDQWTKDRKAPLPIRTNAVISGLAKLHYRGLLKQALDKGFLTLDQPLQTVVNSFGRVHTDYIKSIKEKGDTRGKNQIGYKTRAAASTTTRKYKRLPNGQIAQRQTPNGLEPIFEDE